MRNILKYFFALLLMLVAVMSVSYLQHRFDASDINHAVAAVRAARPLGPQDKTIEEKISAIYHISPEQISWIPTLESKVRGIVSVKVLLPSGDQNLIYHVDLVRLAVLPQSTEAQSLSHQKIE